MRSGSESHLPSSSLARLSRTTRLQSFPDQSRLEPTAMQLPPFEVTGGQRNPDLRSDQRRFFQYQYSLRLINGDMFGKDVRIPSVQVSYHIESRVQRGESVRGRDRTYLLPTESIRVLSLVPNDATDIRDAPPWTFSDIEAQRFRARVLSRSSRVAICGGGQWWHWWPPCAWPVNIVREGSPVGGCFPTAQFSDGSDVNFRPFDAPASGTAGTTISQAGLWVPCESPARLRFNVIRAKSLPPRPPTSTKDNC